MALDEPDEDDEIMLVDGIKIAVDPSIEHEAKSVTIDFIENQFVVSKDNRDFC